jgi:hypothetical protein
MMPKIEFSDIYSFEIQAEISLLEADRKKAANQQVFGIVVLIVSVLFGFFFFQVNPSIAIVLALVLFVFSGRLLYKAALVQTRIVHFFKTKLIPKMIQGIHSKLSYDPSKFVSQSQFVMSKIFQNSIDIYEGEDWVKGTIDNTEIEFSELLVQYITRDSKGNETKNTSFKGIFFVTDFHKDFKGETFVLKDHAQKLFGNMGTFFQRINGARPELILMENPIFEKQFVVYGTDQIESRYIITPALMEKMVDMNLLFKGIQFSFVQSKLFIAIPFSENLFEPKLFKSLENADYLKNYFQILSNCIGIVDTLELNERLWSKV